MQQVNDVGSLALEALRTRITRVLPAQIRSCIEQLSVEQLWWRPNEKSNSVGNLVLHVGYSSGNAHGSNCLRDEDAERRFGQRSLDTDS